MWRAGKSGLWMTLLMLVAAPVLAQESYTLSFSIKPDQEKRALFGAIVRQGGLWKVHSIGLTVHSVNVKKQTCRVSISGHGIVKHKGKKLHQGEPNGYELVPGEPPILLWVDHVRKDLCEGRLSIASPTARDWRGLSGGSFEEIPKEEAAKNVAQLEDPSVTAPELVTKTAVEYTQAALDARVAGSCLMRLVVTADGSVDPKSIYIYKSVGYGLDEASIEELLNHWKFKPGTKDGEPVPVVVIVETTFTLRR